MVDNFKHLIKLQDLDSNIKGISLFLEQIPSQINQIDRRIEESFSAVKKYKEQLAENQKRRRDLDAEVEDLKTKINKFQNQLNDVKTNKEYSSLLKEIDDAKNRVDDLEEEIITKMLASDDIESEIRSAQAKAEQEKQKLLKEKEELMEKSSEMKQKKQSLSQEKAEVEPHIPQDQLSLYHDIYQNNSGIALSPVTDDFCSVCQIRIRPQVINELKEGKKIILCENCGRILYWKNQS
ncbi:MAG: hypothetical protein GF421_09475 [Candidatus Aminicenantes bacterium]|nr:hypothetical protein [Candidatus Aminicenantes bacterium]